MADDRKLQLAALNIVTHPHSPDNYVKLLRALFSLKRPIAIRGTQHLMLGELRPVKKGELLHGLRGRIYRFDQIDPDSPWFNVENNEAATSEEVAEIKIPASLKPNLVMFNFVFFPKGHTLYFEAKADKHTLGPSSLQKFLIELCGIPTIVARFGKVDVTVLPDKEQLDRILKIPRLTKLIVDVKRPNPDDLADEEEEVFSRLRDMGTRRIVQELTAERNESIKPDSDVKLLARVAAKNGSVTGVGYTLEGDKLEESTVDKPWRHTVHFDADVELRTDVMIAQAEMMHGENT